MTKAQIPAEFFAFAKERGFILSECHETIPARRVNGVMRAAHLPTKPYRIYREDGKLVGSYATVSRAIRAIKASA